MVSIPGSFILVTSCLEQTAQVSLGKACSYFQKILLEEIADLLVSSACFYLTPYYVDITFKILPNETSTGGGEQGAKFKCRSLEGHQSTNGAKNPSRLNFDSCQSNKKRLTFLDLGQKGEKLKKTREISRLLFFAIGQIKQ